MIPVGRPSISKDAWKEIRKVLASGQLVEDSYCQKFSEQLAHQLDAPHVILVNSGTSALYLALKALNIGPGDFVLVPAYSFPATANVVSWIGAIPIFTDINPNTWNMDVPSIEKRIHYLTTTQKKRIKAVMPVHAFGNPIDIVSINTFAQARGWKVIEDAACAIGSSVNNKPSGTQGDIGCFSFHPRKILTTSEGGALVVRSSKLANQIKLLKNHGMIKKSGKVLFPGVGLNLRFTEIAAALGLSQLKILPALLDERRNLTEEYIQGMSQLGLETQKVISGAKPNYQSFVARLPIRTLSARIKIFEKLAMQNIQVTIGTYFLPNLPAFRKNDISMLGKAQHSTHYSAAQKLFVQGISLPLFSGLGKDGVKKVLTGLEESLN